MKLGLISKYYSKKILANKNKSISVDWKNRSSQYVRFLYLSKILKKKNFTLTDLGCGDAEFIKYLKKKKFFFKKYIGLDVSKEMILEAKKKYKFKKVIFFNSSKINLKTDYIISSGIFNVRLNNKKIDFYKYIMQTIKMMNKYSKVGFAFNALSFFHDKQYSKKKLYYVDPGKILNFCIQQFSNVRLYHNYKLYDFTVIVEK